MFEYQKIVIKSGSGDNYFEAEANIDRMADEEQTKLIMSGLRAMQKDRMAWVSQIAK